MPEYDLATPTAPLASVEPQRTPWGFADMALAVGVIVLLTVLVSIPVAFIGNALAGDLDVEDDPEALTVVLIASLFLEAIILVAAAAFSIRKYRASWADLGLRLPARGLVSPLPLLRDILPGGGIDLMGRVYDRMPGWIRPGVALLKIVPFSMALVITGSFIVYGYFGLLSLAGLEPESDLQKQAFDNAGPLIVLGVLSLGFAPVVEEIFFRGFIFGGLRGRWGLRGAALASGLLFGLVHIGNPGSVYVVLPVALVGVLFAYGYAYTGSIATTIVAHFLFNLFSFAVGVATS